MATSYKNQSGQTYKIGPGEFGFVRTGGKFHQVNDKGVSSEVTDPYRLNRLENKSDEYADVDSLDDFTSGSISKKAVYDTNEVRRGERVAEQSRQDRPIRYMKPTVLSDTNIRDKRIPDIKDKSKGMLEQESPYYFDSTRETPEEYKNRVAKYNAKQGNAPTEESTGSEPGVSDYESAYQSVMGSSSENDPYWDAATELIDQLQMSSDRKTREALKGISSAFERRRIDLEATQIGEREALEASQLTSGGARYAAASSAGLVSAQERAYIRDLSVIDLEEQQMRSEALAAQEEQDYKLLGSRLELLGQKRTEKLDVVSKMYDEMVAAEKTKNEGIQKIVENAVNNGASPEIISQIAKSGSVEDAYKAAGNFAMNADGAEGKAYAYARANGYSGSPLDFHRQWEAAGRAPTAGSGSGVPGYTGDFEATIGLAAGSMGSVYAQKAMKDQLESSVAAGDWRSAAQAIEMATAAGLSGENKTKFENASIDRYALEDMRNALTAYQEAGGDMNIFKGTADNIGKAIGVLANDPEYASLAVELDRAFQVYRQNMTGAAFGAKESGEYAKVLPQKGSSLDLNLAVIDGALNATNRYVKNSVRAKTGEGGVHILERGASGDKGVGAQAVEDESDGKESVISWSLESRENEEALTLFMSMFPEADTQTIARELGISL